MPFNFCKCQHAGASVAGGVIQAPTFPSGSRADLRPDGRLGGPNVNRAHRCSMLLNLQGQEVNIETRSPSSAGCVKLSGEGKRLQTEHKQSLRRARADKPEAFYFPETLELQAEESIKTPSITNITFSCQIIGLSLFLELKTWIVLSGAIWPTSLSECHPVVITIPHGCCRRDYHGDNPEVKGSVPVVGPPTKQADSPRTPPPPALRRLLFTCCRFRVGRWVRQVLVKTDDIFSPVLQER